MGMRKTIVAMEDSEIDRRKEEKFVFSFSPTAYPKVSNDEYLQLPKRKRACVTGKSDTEAQFQEGMFQGQYCTML